jgi:predicted AlkP superfamily phosphohydrolase/phosphomutase
MAKTVLIGIDGAPFSMLQEFMRTGLMPNLRSLSEQGVFRQMMASIPDNSAVSWSSIMTGDNPGVHGIFGFTDLIPNTYTLRFPNFHAMQSQPFWFQRPEKTYVILNLPFTYPAQPLNGYLISGFVSPDIKKSVYPQQFLQVVNDLGYRIDVDAGKASKSKDLFFDDLFAVYATRIRLYKKLWKEIDWDTFMLVFTGSDRLGHFCWADYEDQTSPYYERFLEYFQKVDGEIGWIAEQLNDDDILIMMSDHGMERIKTEVYLNTYLEQYGLLTLIESKRPNYNNVTEASKAFALEPGRIHLHVQGKYPRGSLAGSDREATLAELTQLFSGLTYEGEKVVKRVLRKEDLYTGPQTEIAPDLVLIPEAGYSLRGVVGRPEVFGQDSLLSGMHRGADAFLYVRGQKTAHIVAQQPTVEDIVPIMNTLEEEAHATS